MPCRAEEQLELALEDLLVAVAEEDDAPTHVCTIDYVAKMLDEDVELLEAIAYNNDNLTYGSIISVYVGPDETITALTDDGIDLVLRIKAKSPR